MELVARGLVKRYPGVLALDDAGLAVRGGRIHAVAGENGAGKSTLMGILSGATTPDAGSIAVDGAPVRLRSPRDAHALGIRMIHQELSLVPGLTVAENIALGAEPARFGVVDRARQRRAAREGLDRLGQRAVDPDMPVERLPLAAQQMVEIAKALAQRARLLILDEPTALLAHDESEALFAVLAQLRADGVAIVYISHRLEEVFRLADDVTVLRDGRVVSSGPVAATSRAEVVRQMVGRELAAGFPPPGVPPGAEVLRAEALDAGPVRGATFALRAGEIVGVVGLVGSGRTELARALFGAAPLEGGAMWLDGVPYRPRSPREATRAGVAFLPEDRKHEGLVLGAPVRENAALASLGARARFGVVRGREERGAVGRWLERLAVRTRSPETPARQLSGGNQQKVVLARWMLTRSRVFLFDEPTRGVDVGAKAEIHARIRALADDGAAVLLISSDLPEALGMADRLLVMREGRILATLERRDATPERVAALILGEAAA